MSLCFILPGHFTSSQGIVYQHYHCYSALLGKIKFLKSENLNTSYWNVRTNEAVISFAVMLSCHSWWYTKWEFIVGIYCGACKPCKKVLWKVIQSDCSIASYVSPPCCWLNMAGKRQGGFAEWVHMHKPWRKPCDCIEGLDRQHWVWRKWLQQEGDYITRCLQVLGCHYNLTFATTDLLSSFFAQNSAYACPVYTAV